MYFLSFFLSLLNQCCFKIKFAYSILGVETYLKPNTSYPLDWPCKGTSQQTIVTYDHSHSLDHSWGDWQENSDISGNPKPLSAPESWQDTIRLPYQLQKISPTSGWCHILFRSLTMEIFPWGLLVESLVVFNGAHMHFCMSYFPCVFNAAMTFPL